MINQPEEQPSNEPAPSRFTKPSLRNTTIVKGSGRNYVIGGVSGFPPSAPKPDEEPAPDEREGDEGKSAD